MNKTNILYLLIIPIKYVLLLLLWVIVTTIVICYIGATYTSNHISFAIAAVISMIVLFVLCIFIGKDLYKKFKEYNEQNNVNKQ